VRANQTRTAAEIIESLHEAASQYAGAEKPKDDITVVIVKILAPATGLPPVPEQLAAAKAIPPVSEDSSGNRDRNGTASFHADQYDDITVIRFVDTKFFDTDNYAQLQRDLVDFVERQQPRKLLVDLGRIEYCSTALISGLLMAQRRVTAAAGTMKLFGLREVVLESLQHLKLVDTMLWVYANETVARDAC
jgi:anti-anti-sigma regulatory factor